MQLLPLESKDELDKLKEAHHKCLEEELNKSQMVRQSKWTQSMAVGDKSFVEQIKNALEFVLKIGGFLKKKMATSYVTDRPVMAPGPNLIVQIHFIGI